MATDRSPGDPAGEHTQLVLISGISGSGKSIALNVLEDTGFTCVDNLPVALVEQTMAILQREYPDLVPMYDALYASRYVRKDYGQRVQEVVSLMRQRYLPSRSHTSAREPVDDSGNRRRPGD